MADHSHTEQVEAPKGRRKSKNRLQGLKLYIGLYTVGWLAVLILLLSTDPAMWIYTPVPILSLILLYFLWKLKHWAWTVTLLIHFLAFLYTSLSFLTNEIELSTFGIRTVLTIVFASYLYLKKDYFD